MKPRQKSYVILACNTAAFFVSFACWVIYGILVTFLCQRGIFNWDAVEIGWLIGCSVLTGSLLRLPVGMLTDRYGGRSVFTALMVISAAGIFMVSTATTYAEFFVYGLGFGLAGTSFAVGFAHTAQVFERERQGFALGIFGVGNLGAAFTALVAPPLLTLLTEQGTSEGWRNLPRLYALALALFAVFYFLFTGISTTRRGQVKSWREALGPLRRLRVWYFGYTYFCLFGGFVALAQWLVPYYVNKYGESLEWAGVGAALFSAACSLSRPLGGYFSDRWGARGISLGVFVGVSLIAAVLALPGINLGIFSTLVVVLGLMMGIGMAAIYKDITVYFPDNVGVVGGLVGVIGGLGGFFLPMAFGVLLQHTASWHTCWIVLAVMNGLGLVWLAWIGRTLPKVGVLQADMPTKEATSQC